MMVLLLHRIHPGEIEGCIDVGCRAVATGGFMQGFDGIVWGVVALQVTLPLLLQLCMSTTYRIGLLSEVEM